MRIDPETCRDPDLLAAEVRRLQGVIAAGESARLSQNSDCPAQDNAAELDKVFPQQNLTIHGAAPAAAAQLDTAGRDSDHVAGTGSLLTDEERESLAIAAMACEDLGYTALPTSLRNIVRRLRGTPDTHATPSQGSKQVTCTLTDEEREAIAWCVGMAETTATDCDEELAALRGLLDRTK
jgi:hypothetical protein